MTGKTGYCREKCDDPCFTRTRAIVTSVYAETRRSYFVRHEAGCQPHAIQPLYSALILSFRQG